LSKLVHEVESFIKEALSMVLSIIHWVSTVTLVLGLLAVMGSLEKTISFMIQEFIIPSIVTNILTGILMEILETRFPSIYRPLRRILGRLS